MELKSRKAYMDAIYERYHKCPKQSKSRILNEVCEVCGYHRKYAIRRISQWRANQGQAQPRKRRRRETPRQFPRSHGREAVFDLPVADHPFGAQPDHERARPFQDLHAGRGLLRSQEASAGDAHQRNDLLDRDLEETTPALREVRCPDTHRLVIKRRGF